MPICPSLIIIGCIIFPWPLMSIVGRLVGRSDTLSCTYRSACFSLPDVFSSLGDILTGEMVGGVGVLKQLGVNGWHSHQQVHLYSMKQVLQEAICVQRAKYHIRLLTYEYRECMENGLFEICSISGTEALCRTFLCSLSSQTPWPGRILAAF